MDETVVRVSCDFCGKEIECPKHMLETAKKHMCHTCFQDRIDNGSGEELKDVHVDLPPEKFIEETAERMVDKMIDKVFPLVWSERKDEFKELSKKDLAYEMFGAGAYIALSNLMKLQHEQGMKKDDAEQRRCEHE
ncbi:MAG TPA: hypothetical protein VJH22_00620 [Candidatus Nanoarchaeia archaeon]|nr:hypothetical protein [Candidatus Nanoarchaeia archaeon]